MYSKIYWEATTESGWESLIITQTKIKTQSHHRLFRHPSSESTLLLSRYTQKDSVAFNVWDIGGQASMSTVNQCFFTDKALYMVIWNLALGEEAVANLQTWLLNIEVNTGTPADSLGPSWCMSVRMWRGCLWERSRRCLNKDNVCVSSGRSDLI